QAEDGIRDRNVTGVQTCALPISTLLPAGQTTAVTVSELGQTYLLQGVLHEVLPVGDFAFFGVQRNIGFDGFFQEHLLGVLPQVRSEERRVGRGCGGVVWL